MHDAINHISKAIEPLKKQIMNHRVYSAIQNPEHLRIFMKYHVFAVWDFMSLLKVLQKNLTCTEVPWFPVGSGNMRYLINEIVLGEESDLDFYGNRKSHFEIYLDAMHQSRADLRQINDFLEQLKIHSDIRKALSLSLAPTEVQDFVNFTFDIIKSNQTHLQSAIFTFGREDLIPGMFISLVNDLNSHFPDTISIFKYYLERHIEIDGDHHSKLALEMTSTLCGHDENLWQEAEQAVVRALQMRIKLWDGVHRQITAGQQ